MNIFTWKKVKKTYCISRLFIHKENLYLKSYHSDTKIGINAIIRGRLMRGGGGGGRGRGRLIRRVVTQVLWKRWVYLRGDLYKGGGGGGGGGAYRRRNTVSTLLYDSRLERISSHTLITPRRTHGDMYNWSVVYLWKYLWKFYYFTVVGTLFQKFLAVQFSSVQFNFI